MPNEQTCLVLGAREAIVKLEAPIGTALEAMNLRRVFVEDLGSYDEVLRTVDVVLADVSKLAPAISFQLGAAKAFGVRALYVARQGSRVSPVFDPVVFYNDAESSAVRLGFVLARALEDTLKDRPIDGHTGVQLDGGYRLGDQFVGVTVHVDPSGYALVSQVGHRPGLLPFSLTLDPDVVNRGDRSLREGDLLSVEVDAADGDRVTFREVEPLPPTRLPADLRNAQAVVRAAAMVSAVTDPKDVSARADRDRSEQRAFEWASINPTSVKRLRRVRNALGHGEPVPGDELAELAAIANQLFEVVTRQDSSSPDPSAVRYRFVESVARAERALDEFARASGVGLSTRPHSLRSLAVIAERYGALPPEMKDLLAAIGRVRSELAHENLGSMDLRRLELGTELAVAAERFLDESHRLVASIRRPSP